MNDLPQQEQNNILNTETSNNLSLPPQGPQSIDKTLLEESNNTEQQNHRENSFEITDEEIPQSIAEPHNQRTENINLTQDQPEANDNEPIVPPAENNDEQAQNMPQNNPQLQQNLASIQENLTNLTGILESFVSMNNIGGINGNHQNIGTNIQGNNLQNLQQQLLGGSNGAQANTVTNNNGQNLNNNQNLNQNGQQQNASNQRALPPIFNLMYGFNARYQQGLQQPPIQQEGTVLIPRGFRKRVQAYLKEHAKDINLYLLFTALIATIIFLIGAIYLPNKNGRSPDYIIEWLAINKHAKYVLFGATLGYLIFVIKFVEALYRLFLSDSSQDVLRMLLGLLLKHSPFYDLGFYLLVDFGITGNKFEFYFILWMLIWQLMSNKTATLGFNKLKLILTDVGNNNADINIKKIKKIQYLGGLIFLINFQLTAYLIWVSWYSSTKMLLTISVTSILGIINPFKVFLSSTSLTKNYRLLTNNNQKELSDPKYKSELFLECVHQGVYTLLLVWCTINSRYLTAFVAVYWLSFSSALQKFFVAFKKLRKWRKIQKKINKVLPLIEKKGEATDGFCTICHESLLIYRQLPCGHHFHIKCLIYWLENHKTCPNCRADISHLHILDEDHTSRISRFFTKLVQRIKEIF